MCPGAESRWSLAELIQAVILMAHAHALSSFVWGCGVNPEPDHTGGHAFSPPSPNHLPHSPHSPAHEEGRPEVSEGGGFRLDCICRCGLEIRGASPHRDTTFITGGGFKR